MKQLPASQRAGGIRALALSVSLFLAGAARAQIVNDGATNTLSNVTTNITGDVTVGTNGSFTLLILSDNALLTNSVRGLIGRNATAKSNEVRLVSASARWRMGNTLFVGSNGASSRLMVSNGALVENFDGILANGIASSNNVALVIGGGSIWSNRGNLAVGVSGWENQLIVSNGGFVANRFGYLGQQPGSSNNVARVSGSGSVWSNQFDLAVGANDRSNRLIIEGGGVVSCANGVVSGSSSSGNNEVLVTGPGSLWSNRFFLFMGDVAGRNRLVVSNGATVWSGGGILGTLSPAISNQVIVTGPGSVWTNQSTLTLGESSSGNSVDVSNGGQLACADGSVGLGAGANNNTVLVTGPGSIWNNLTNLMVGNSGSGNVLITSNGATGLAGSLFVGFNSSAISNLATVTGPGTSWLVASNLYVGSNGAFNLLVVSNGASLADDIGLLSGGASGASNRVLVTGSGSIWNNRVGLVIGNQSGGNQLTVSNGGVVLNGFCSIGVNASSNNSVQVTGAGSVWSNALLLRIGSFGVGNRVVIENGARLESEDASVGAFSANNEAVITGAGSLWNNRDQLSVGGVGSGNRLVISNAAVASTVNALIVGEVSASTSNRVVVDGGTLRATNAVGTSVLDVRRGTNVLNAGLIDVDRLLLTNTLGKFQFNGGTLVTRGAFINNNAAFNVGNSGGTPATWDIRAGVSDHVLAGQLFLGNNTTLNQLLVTNGALLASGDDVFIGYNTGGNSNTAIISGMGSRWAVDTSLVDTYLQVGYFGSFNRLVVSNGGWVASTFGEIGRFAVVGYDKAEVTGAGSVWTNSWDLRVGVNGTGNSLVVTNGGTVVSSNTYLGFSADSSANDVVVTDAGSVLSNRATLFVGYGGVGGNRLLVSNGGVVRDNNGEIGLNFTTFSSDNMAVVTGTGSLWSNNDHLWVGVFGARNQLVVSNGGQVACGTGVIGGQSPSSNNLAVVTGSGSLWSNAAALFVGSNGMGNRLVISNGGFVAATDPGTPMIVGHGPNSANNEVLITGAGSVYSNVAGINVDLGENGSSNRMRIEGGGLLVANVLIGRSTSSTGNVLTVTGPSSRILVPRDDIEIFVGGNGSGNLLVVSNGAAVFADGAAIGYNETSRDNLAVVTGAGSVWHNQNVLQVGRFGPNNRLLITDGGGVSSTNAVNVGFQTTTSSNNLLHVANGTLRVTNALATGTLDVRSGTNRLDAGLVDVDRLTITNARGFFEFNGGTISARNSLVNNGRLFRVGNGGSPATFALTGNGTHSFANGLTVSANATLTGNGTVSGFLTVQASGTLAPGASIGKIVLSNSPALQGATIMEISKNGATITNDQLQVTAPLTYGGSLIVTNLGPTALAAGDKFSLFSATSYAGSFASLSLPPLSAGLGWTNKLLVDGSIEVIGIAQPKFASITVSGTNVILSGTGGPPNAPYAVLTATNVALPVSSWVSLVTNQFDSGGGFSFTNSIAPGIPQRFFRIRIP